MTFYVLTIFPELITFYLKESIVKRAIQRGLIDVKVINIRDYTVDKHHCTDDYPYGGGAGMVMKVEPLYYAYRDVISDGGKRRSILLTPQGNTFNQKKAEEFASLKTDLLLICGRYEGVDERVKCIVDEELSVGDFILTGGEPAALIVIDSVTRLIHGVLGDERSNIDESFSTGILDYPHYTRPAEFMGMKAPDVLLSGNHFEINRWRRKSALKKTILSRPDLINKKTISIEDNKILKELKEEMGDEFVKRFRGEL